MRPIAPQPSEPAITAVASPVKVLGVGVLAEVVYEPFVVFPMPPTGVQIGFGWAAVTGPLNKYHFSYNFKVTPLKFLKKKKKKRQGKKRGSSSYFGGQRHCKWPFRKHRGWT